jgi:glycosyltransferase involved in cell wall biosynthesis
MNKLILDLSPAIVNRTAVYHMVIDVSKRLSIDYDTQLSVLGKRISWKKSPALLSELNPKKENYFKRLIGKHINGSFFRPITYFFHNRPVPSGTRRLFFDALYVPFAGLSHRDIVIVHDLTTLTFPSWHGVKVSEAYAKAFERISSSRCRIISVSQSTTHELRFHLGISSERIVTIPNYLRISDFESSSENSGNDAENFFLFIGSSEKRKNLSGLIQAFNRTGLANEGYSLKIVGMDGNDAEKIRDLSLEIAGVELLGFVDDKTLAKLYSRCRAFLYPSFWEGFGMPLLEAMAQGCLCVSTSTGASPEVGGNAVIYVDPCNIDSIAAGILTTERMGSEERNTMKVLARERAKLFSFEKYYERMKNTIQCGFEK